MKRARRTRAGRDGRPRPWLAYSTWRPVGPPYEELRSLEGAGELSFLIVPGRRLVIRVGDVEPGPREARLSFVQFAEVSEALRLEWCRLSSRIQLWRPRYIRWFAELLPPPRSFARAHQLRLIQEEVWEQYYYLLPGAHIIHWSQRHDISEPPDPSRFLDE